MNATDKLRDITETLVLHSAGSGPERIAHVIAMIGSFRVQSLKVIDEIEKEMKRNTEDCARIAEYCGHPGQERGCERSSWHIACCEMKTLIAKEIRKGEKETDANK